MDTINEISFGIIGSLELCSMAIAKKLISYDKTVSFFHASNDKFDEAILDGTAIDSFSSLDDFFESLQGSRVVLIHSLDETNTSNLLNKMENGDYLLTITSNDMEIINRKKQKIQKKGINLFDMGFCTSSLIETNEDYHLFFSGKNMEKINVLNQLFTKLNSDESEISKTFFVGNFYGCSKVIQIVFQIIEFSLLQYITEIIMILKTTTDLENKQIKMALSSFTKEALKFSIIQKLFSCLETETNKSHSNESETSFPDKNPFLTISPEVNFNISPNPIFEFLKYALENSSNVSIFSSIFPNLDKNGSNSGFQHFLNKLNELKLFLETNNLPEKKKNNYLNGPLELPKVKSTQILEDMKLSIPVVTYCLFDQILQFMGNFENEENERLHIDVIMKCFLVAESPLNNTLLMEISKSMDLLLNKQGNIENNENMKSNYQNEQENELKPIKEEIIPEEDMNKKPLNFRIFKDCTSVINEVIRNQNALRRICTLCTASGLPCPLSLSALLYYDQLCNSEL